MTDYKHATICEAFIACGLTPPSVPALGVSVALPSVANTGHRSKRAVRKAEGATTAYAAATFDPQGLRDSDWYRVQAHMGAKASNKTNHLSGLAAQVMNTDGSVGFKPLITRHMFNGVRICTLTDEGLAEVKAYADAEVFKYAKANFTEAALEKRIKAEAKAAKAAAQGDKPARKRKPVEAEAEVEAQPVEVEAEVIVPVEAEPVTIETA